MHHFSRVALVTLTALRMPGPLSPRNASYTIEATLDGNQHTVTGKEKLEWRNTANAPASELKFHLYMNAFKNQSSTFFAESRGAHRGMRSEKHGWGSIDVSRVRVDGRDVTAQWKVDDTVATLPLAEPFAPGSTHAIEIEWKTLLPKVYARTGYHDDFFAVAQWFPKIGVFDGSWHAHQHHLNSEFFADYGIYDVTVTVPAKMEVGATGVLTDEKRSDDTKTLRFHAEDVHDFALFACPRFVIHEDQFSDSLGKLRIVLLSLRGHEAAVAQHLAATRAGLEELTRRFGPFPYSQLTVVDVADGAEGAAGMEYPTLFTTFSPPLPRGVHAAELVTIHELSHQYFQGMVGSDEVEEAWLDEGLTETMTDLGLEHLFPPSETAYSFAGRRLALEEMNRNGYARRPDLDAMETRSFDFLDNGSYGRVTYAKTDVVMRTVEKLLGRERFEAGWRRYYEDWRFKHPRIDDFVRSFDAGAGEDLRWFWDPALRSSQVLDYEVLSVDVRPKRAPGGLFDADGGAREVEPSSGRDDKKPPFTSEVVIRRRGEFVFPVELEVEFSDGTKKRERWDGGKPGDVRWRRFTYEGDTKVVSARIESPPLDVSRWNDARLAEPDRAPRRRVTGAFAALLSTLLSAVGF
jgi:hypothetical protein